MNSTLPSPHLQRRGTAATVPVFGVDVQILVDGAFTGGVSAAYLASCVPGAGAPPHRHAGSDESFYILEGSFDVRCGEATQRMEAGDFVFLPRGTAHDFKCVGPQPGRLLGTSQPAGHEKFFRDCAAAVANGTFSPEVGRAICVEHGIELLGPA